MYAGCCGQEWSTMVLLAHAAKPVLLQLHSPLAGAVNRNSPFHQLNQACRICKRICYILLGMA
jgi:hypothetical protein